MRRRIALAVLLVLAAAGCGSDEPSRRDQGRSIASEAGLARDVGDFFALALGSTTATYSLTYATTDRAGGPVQITLAQQPPNRRVDVFRSDGSVETTLRLGSAAYQCSRAAGDAEGPWECGPLGGANESAAAATDPLSAETITAAIERFRDRAADYDFAIDHRSVAGVAATCLVTTRKEGHEQDPTLGASATLCLSPEGAILSVEVPTGSYSATGYTTTIADGTFDLPATPGQAPATSS